MAEVEIHTGHGHSDDEFGRRVGVAVGVIGIVLAVVTIGSHRAHTAAVMGCRAAGVKAQLSSGCRRRARTSSVPARMYNSMNHATVRVSSR